MRERAMFFYKRILILIEGVEVAPFENHSNNCWRQDPQKNAEVSGWKFKEKQNIWI